MKHIMFRHIFLALAMLVGLVSCEDRELVTIENSSAPIVMDLSKETLTLDANFPGNTALTLAWQPSAYTVPVEMLYRVEISATQDFKTKETLASLEDSHTTVSFTTKEINEAAKKIGLVPNQLQKMYFRVVGYLGTGSMAATSNISSITVKPYLASPTYTLTDLYLIGDATAGAWDNNATNNNLYPLQKTSDKTRYTYTGFFKKGAFKVIQNKGAWDVQYGRDEAAPGKLSQEGSSKDIAIDESGYYKVSIDTANLTYTVTKIAAPTKTYTSVSIIGSVNGNWDTDTMLTQSAHDPHVWVGFSVPLKDGEFKFRANKAWDVSWGTNAPWFGTATTNGANIPLTDQWIYNVYFNDFTGEYTIIPVK